MLKTHSIAISQRPNRFNNDQPSKAWKRKRRKWQRPSRKGLTRGLWVRSRLSMTSWTSSKSRKFMRHKSRSMASSRTRLCCLNSVIKMWVQSTDKNETPISNLIKKLQPHSWDRKQIFRLKSCANSAWKHKILKARFPMHPKSCHAMARFQSHGPNSTSESRDLKSNSRLSASNGNKKSRRRMSLFTTHWALLFSK